MQEPLSDDDDGLVIYLADQDYPEFGIERGDHVVVTGLGETFPLRVVKLKDRKEFVKVMSCGALDRMTLLSGRLDPVPFEPSPAPSLPLRSRTRRRAPNAPQK